MGFILFREHRGVDSMCFHAGDRCMDHLLADVYLVMATWEDWILRNRILTPSCKCMECAVVVQAVTCLYLRTALFTARSDRLVFSAV
jgi:hypothetical protein